MSTGTKYGICYNPTWPGYTGSYPNSGPNAQLSDADFFNVSFQALWNAGTDANGNVYRDDLGTIGGGGFNLVRLYNWGPTRGWDATTQVGTAHLDFLDYASKNGIQVIVPVSNYFLSDDTYAWNGNNPGGDYSFGSAPAAMQTALTQFLSSVTKNGKLHPAVHSFSVGNEIDINTLQGQGSSGIVDPASRLARIIWWIVNLQGQMTANSLGQALLTSPISNADQGNPGTTPASYWFGALAGGVTGGTTPLPQGTTGGSGTFGATWSGLSGYTWFADWYYNSVNIYQSDSGLSATLTQYDAWKSNTTNNLNWPGQQFAVPLLLTEFALSPRGAGSAGENAEFASLVGQVTTVTDYLASNPGSLVMGFCIYEFNDEAYLNANWGIFMEGNVLYNEPTGTTQVSYATWPSVDYPVNQLNPVTNSTTGQTLIAALSAIFNPPAAIPFKGVADHAPAAT
ncbi:hypothetical protein [Longimicrobium sp.]|uniref:hypothetical protein n=1 Tax=Longimicrobium sp. TaxID=2029185 RepID=UPI003B3BB851